MIYSWYHL